ncbi:MAG TPA: hypothetical protein DCS25_00715 [Sulfitobacter pontiacus]|nr:hypothetical protein [Roseobacter sp.]HAR80900.1 hypothetical protein [Sulfitobacter pontiacus]
MIGRLLMCQVIGLIKKLYVLSQMLRLLKSFVRAFSWVTFKKILKIAGAKYPLSKLMQMGGQAKGFWSLTKSQFLLNGMVGFSILGFIFLLLSMLRQPTGSRKLSNLGLLKPPPAFIPF